MSAKIFSIARLGVVISVLMVGTYKPLSADMVTGVSLGAQSIVDAFNGMNYGTGFNYLMTNPANAGIRFLSDVSMGNGSTQSPNTNAYYYAQNNPFPDDGYFSNTASFISLEVGPNVSMGWGTIYGSLNYGNGASMTNYGNTLKVGAAYLYQILATTDDIDRYGTDGADLAAAIRFLIGQPYTYEDHFTDWDNQYLQMLLGINDDQDYWQSAYNPDAYYDEIGNYSIFVMNAVGPLEMIAMRGMDATPYYVHKDYLYIAEAAMPYEPATTPEQATMLMVGLGLAGLPFVRRLRKTHGFCGNTGK